MQAHERVGEIVSGPALGTHDILWPHKANEVPCEVHYARRYAGSGSLPLRFAQRRTVDRDGVAAMAKA